MLKKFVQFVFFLCLFYQFKPNKKRNRIRMKRIIVDYSKITKEIMDLLVEKYPDGYNAIDVISFRDKNKNLIDAIQVESNDAVYLVKVSKKLSNTMEEYDTNDEQYEDYDDQDLLFDTELPEAAAETDEY